MRTLAAALFAASLIAQGVPAGDVMGTPVYIYEGGSIYHQKDCVSLTGRVNVHAVALKELGKGFDPCPTCRAPQRTPGAPFGPIAAQYATVLAPPSMSATALQLATSTITETGGATRAKCAAEWPDDFRMRAYCEQQQKQALLSLGARSMTSADQITIRNKCRRDWPTDYRMQDYCETEQLKALASIK